MPRNNPWESGRFSSEGFKQEVDQAWKYIRELKELWGLLEERAREFVIDEGLQEYFRGLDVIKRYQGMVEENARLIEEKTPKLLRAVNEWEQGTGSVVAAQQLQQELQWHITNLRAAFDGLRYGIDLLHPILQESGGRLAGRGLQLFAQYNLLDAPIEIADRLFPGLLRWLMYLQLG